MKLFIVDKIENIDEECLYCGNSDEIYVLADDYEQACKEFDNHEAGLCKGCMMELLVDEGYEIDATRD